MKQQVMEATRGIQLMGLPGEHHGVGSWCPGRGVPMLRDEFSCGEGGTGKVTTHSLSQTLSEPGLIPSPSEPPDSASLSL